MRRRFLALAAMAVMLATPVGEVSAAVAAGSNPATVAASLAKDPVYVDPHASPTISAGDADNLRSRISGAPVRIFIAVLPPVATAGEAAAQLQAIAKAVGTPGVYAAISGHHFNAGDLDGAFPPAVQLADSIVARDRGHSAAGVLQDYVTAVIGSVAAQASGNGTGPPARGTSGQSSHAGLIAALVVLAILAVVAVAVVTGVRRRRASQDNEFAEVRASAEEDVTALGEDIAKLDLDVGSPSVDDATRADYAAAIDSFTAAGAALRRATRAPQLGEVSSALAEGRYRMACVRARQEGREPPPRRPPCFFNPTHGPSVAEVDWSPPGGVTRSVPVCAADVDRLNRGEDPAYRQVLVGGVRQPYWLAPPAWGPWAGGYYGGWGGLGPGLLGGLLLGEALAPQPVDMDDGWANAPGSDMDQDWSGGGGDWTGGGFDGGGGF
jgi:uncharacterized membrane protein YgcG